jgi:hypothetical protein
MDSHSAIQEPVRSIMPKAYYVDPVTKCQLEVEKKSAVDIPDGMVLVEHGKGKVPLLLDAAHVFTQVLSVGSRAVILENLAGRESQRQVIITAISEDSKYVVIRRTDHEWKVRDDYGNEIKLASEVHLA